jgi:hypothetical protein
MAANPRYEEVLAARAKADAAYTVEWNRFKRFIDRPTNICTVDENGKYLTRSNVDAYFVSDIAIRDCVVGTAERAIPALNWYAKNLEYKDVFPRFQVKSPMVEEGLVKHKARYISNQLIKYVDAHASLPTEKVSHDDTTTLLKTALTMECWADVFLSYNVDMQTMCRGNTLRKLRLCDIVADANHGPGNPKEGNLPLMLTFVLKRITGAKDAAAHVRIIGMWPHRDFLRCGTGAIAAALFSRFYFDSETSFYFDHHDGLPPSWYNLMLVSWRTYKPMGEAYHRLYKKANVKPAGGKVTHLRKASINDAGQGGVSREHISRMSKHAADKIDTSYLSELPPEVLHVAAGFSVRHGEKLYHVPRTLITFETLIPGRPDLSSHDLANMLFPRRNIWLEDFERSPVLDLATKNFLTVLLPHLAKVITQDGIYWISHFPDHDISRLLLLVFGPTYVDWAAEKRLWVRSSESAVQERQIDRLNAGSQAALASVHTLVAQSGGISARIETKLDAMGEVVATQQNTLKDIVMMQRLIVTTLNARNRREYRHPPNQLHSDDTASSRSVHSNVSNALPMSERSLGLQYHNDDVPLYFGSTRERMIELAPPLGQPAIPMGMPLTIQNLVIEHLELKLDHYKLENKKNWPHSLSMRFSRRCYLMKEVKRRAGLVRCGDYASNLQEAARIMDVERQCMSVTKFHAHLKAVDPCSHKRSRTAL